MYLFIPMKVIHVEFNTYIYTKYIILYIERENPETFILSRTFGKNHIGEYLRYQELRSSATNQINRHILTDKRMFLSNFLLTIAIF